MTDVEARVTQHWPLVRWEVQRFLAARPTWLRDELESAAALGLLQAAMRFDVAAGVPFAAYARQRIRGAMVDALRDWTAHRCGGPAPVLIPIEEAGVRVCPSPSPEAVLLGRDRRRYARRVMAAQRTAAGREVLRRIAAGQGPVLASRAVGKSDSYGSTLLGKLRRQAQEVM